jgi:protein ImuA
VEYLMGHSSPRLQHLRQSLAGLDPTLAPHLCDPERALPLGVAAIDRALGGGLPCGALHELAPAAPIHLAAATGYAAALAARSAGAAGQVLWIETDLVARETGGPYGPGLDLFGLPAERLIMLRVPRAVDALWAMEEALRCRALKGIIAELGGDSGKDLTATRRVALAARDGTGLGLLLRQRATPAPCAATTRWHITAGPSRPDAFGGLGPATFDLSLIKNRRGPTGRWTITWDHHERAFHAAVSLGVAEAARDRSDRAPLIRTG